MKPLHVFRAGTHTDMHGTTVTLTDADLAASAAAYDPARHETPIVVGHPRADAPAYGWLSKLQATGADLFGVPAQVDPAFAELVDAGRFKKISLSWYTPDSPSNPVPGVWYPRHVGFLGATPPAIKGLKAVEFADGETGVIEFADWALTSQASMWRRLRDWLIGQFGQDTADNVLPSYSIDTLIELGQARPDPASHSPSPAFTETQESSMNEQEIAAMQAENARLKQQQAQAQREAAERARQVRHAESVAFAEQLVAERKLIARHKPVVVALLDHAKEPAADGVVEFADGDTRQPLHKAIESFLGDHSTPVAFGEHYTRDKRPHGDQTRNPLVADAERRNKAVA